MTGTPLPAADITADGTGPLCVTLLIELHKHIRATEPGTVVHIIATAPAAPSAPPTNVTSAGS